MPYFPELNKKKRTDLHDCRRWRGNIVQAVGSQMQFEN
jgi:hypothetical protein